MPPGTQVAQANTACYARGAGKIDYVQTITATTSDRPGPVLAQVLSGPLQGARLLGAFDKQDDALFVRFSTLAIGDQTVSVEGVAVSPETSETAVVTSIDRHYFERYVLPIAASFVAGFGQAVARSGQTVTQGVLGTTVANPAQTTRDQLFAAAGTAGQYASQALSNSAPSGPTINLASGYAMGVMWLRPVPTACP
jgi:intracellular multiplication protein IcmE